MKKIKLIAICTLLFASNSYAWSNEHQDTTIYFNDKIIQISDSIDQISVKVSARSGCSIDTFKTVFEGLYSDKKTYERWSVTENWGIQIPFVTNRLRKTKRNEKMTPHWAGFGMGFATMTDGSSYNNVNGMDLVLGRSLEFNYNIAEHITPIFFNIIGLTSGVGFSIRKYQLDNSLFLKEINNVVDVYSNSPLEYDYSKLVNCYLTAPLLLELQLFKNQKNKPYLAAGVIGGIRLSSVFKSKYYSTSGSTIRSKSKGMNVLPLTMDYVVMGGHGNCSVYMKYSPLQIFEKNKGPEVQHASIGFMFDI
jgi:hypothetical protein